MKIPQKKTISPKDSGKTKISGKKTVSRLEKKAEKNTTVALMEGKKVKEVLKQGNPAPDTKSLQSSNIRIAGLSKGVTLNMGDYQSLRIDVWLTEFVQDGEDHSEVLNSLGSVIDSRINYESELYGHAFKLLEKK